MFSLLLAPGMLACAAAAQQDPTLRVDVRLVNVFATVLDQHGAPIASLQKHDFQVYEDGVLQQLAVFQRESELPLSIVLAIDASQSTRRHLRLQVDAARRFVRSILRPVDAVSVFQFDDEVRQLVTFTADVARINRALSRVRIGSATALYDAIYLGAEALARRDGRKVLVILSDGGDTYSQVGYAEALRSAQQAEAIIYSIITVPIQSSAGRNLGGENALIQLSRDSGGKHYYATGVPELEQVFAQISDELRTQYLLAYYPARRAGGPEFRRIEVKVNPPAGDREQPAAVTVRHRAGYYPR